MSQQNFLDNDPAGPITGAESFPGIQSGGDVLFSMAALLAKAWDRTLHIGTQPQSSIVGLVAALAEKALDAAVVKLTGDQAIAGIKTFASAPVVPADSWTISDTAGLQDALDALPIDSSVVHDTGNETIAGIKTFSSAPVVPDGSWSIADTFTLQSALNAKAADADVVKLTGTQTIAGTKTFASSPIVPTPTTTGQAATKGYVDGIVTPVLVPDPGLDDTAQIAASAVASGGVLLGPGTFIASSVLLRSGLRIQGTGQGITVLKQKDNSDVVFIQLAAGSLTDVHISDLTIDGNKANQSAAATATVQFAAFTHSSIRRVTVKNAEGIAIKLYQGSDLEVSDCTVLDCGSSNTSDGSHTGIWASEVTRLKVNRNTVSTASDCGVIANECEDAVICNNIIRDCFFIGIALGLDGSGYTVNGNVIKNCAGNGIDTGTCTNVSIVGNRIIDCFDGIDADLSTLGSATVAALTIADNTIHSSANYGIVVLGPASLATAATISGNTVNDSQLHGISLINFHSSTVTGNVVRNASRSVAGFAGIAINNGQDNIVSANRCVESGTAVMNGIDRATGTNNYNIYTSNNLRGLVADFAGAAGANDVAANNIV